LYLETDVFEIGWCMAKMNVLLPKGFHKVLVDENMALVVFNMNEDHMLRVVEIDVDALFRTGGKQGKA
jgi:hypothetical protein